MNNVFILYLFILAVLLGCSNDDHSHDGHDEDQYQHEGKTYNESDLETLAFTIYTDKTELFVEFKPLIVGQSSNFAAHFTKLGDSFKSIDQGSVTLYLNGNEIQPENKVNSPSSPGIFRLELEPTKEGLFQLVFELQTDEYSDTITIDEISVYLDVKTALTNQKEEPTEDEIVYLKEQAWKIDFSNTKAKVKTFSEIIKTTGQILPAMSDEAVITAKGNGIVTSLNSNKLVGSYVEEGETLFTISGGGLTENNIDEKYKKARANYEKTKRDYDRAEKMVKDNIISSKDFQKTQLDYENAKITFNTISNNYESGGQKITAPIEGYVKSIFVSQGHYVETGQAIAIISQNRKLILTAEVGQKDFSLLPDITSANFVTAYNNKIYDSDSLNGKLISYGKNTNVHSYFIPVNIEIDNNGDLIPGSFIEVYLKTQMTVKALIIPHTALIEEHGIFYVYVQTSGEGFQKREVTLGASDGINVQVLSGITENERVVTKGANQIKLATMSGKIPAHGHEH